MIHHPDFRSQFNEPGNRKLATLMNSDQVVSLLLESDGTIVDCHVYRRKELLLKIVKYEVWGHSNNK